MTNQTAVNARDLALEYFEGVYATRFNRAQLEDAFIAGYLHAGETGVSSTRGGMNDG